MSKLTEKISSAMMKLDRNDLDGALALARELLEAGETRSDLMQGLIMLQDDQAGFVAALNKLTQEKKDDDREKN